MKLNADQLDRHLEQSLAPIYLIHGDEPLLVQEARQQIRHYAEQQGYNEHSQFTLTTTFNWEPLWQTASNLSLFSQRQIIELSIPNGKPGDKGAKNLIAYANAPAADTILLITSGKLASSSQRTRWYKALLEKSVVIPVWPIDRARLPQWLNRRMQQVELSSEPQGLQLLADRVEGNLLAASQEIEKLRLIYGPGPLTAEQIAAAVGCSSRFDVFKLVDSMLLGEMQRAGHILQGLRAEGIDPILILWAISRELRLLAQIAYGIEHGKPFAQLCRELGVWQSRQSITQRALQQKTARHFQRLLHKAHEIDTMLKGLSQGDPWQALLGISVRL